MNSATVGLIFVMLGVYHQSLCCCCWKGQGKAFRNLLVIMTNKVLSLFQKAVVWGLGAMIVVVGFLLLFFKKFGKCCQ